MGNDCLFTDQTPTGVEVRNATIKDADDIIWKLSRRKIKDFKQFFESVNQGIRDLIQDSEECLCITHEGKPAALFGIQGSDGISAVMWSAITSIAEDHPVKCLKTARLILDRFNETYQVLASSIPDDDPMQLRWVKLLGCDTYHEREGRISFMRVAQ